MKNRKPIMTGSVAEALENNFKPTDINLTNTQKKAILNRIAELTNHGLNSVEVSIRMPTVYKAQLIRIIKDFIEKELA